MATNTTGNTKENALHLLKEYHKEIAEEESWVDNLASVEWCLRPERHDREELIDSMTGTVMADFMPQVQCLMDAYSGTPDKVDELLAAANAKVAYMKRMRDKKQLEVFRLEYEEFKAKVEANTYPEHAWICRLLYSEYDNQFFSGEDVSIDFYSTILHYSE